MGNEQSGSHEEVDPHVEAAIDELIASTDAMHRDDPELAKKFRREADAQADDVRNRSERERWRHIREGFAKIFGSEGELEDLGVEQADHQDTEGGDADLGTKLGKVERPGYRTEHVEKNSPAETLYRVIAKKFPKFGIEIEESGLDVTGKHEIDEDEVLFHVPLEYVETFGRLHDIFGKGTHFFNIFYSNESARIKAVSQFCKQYGFSEEVKGALSKWALLRYHEELVDLDAEIESDENRVELLAERIKRIKGDPLTNEQVEQLIGDAIDHETAKALAGESAESFDVRSLVRKETKEREKIKRSDNFVENIRTGSIAELFYEALDVKFPEFKIDFQGGATNDYGEKLDDTFVVIYADPSRRQKMEEISAKAFRDSGLRSVFESATVDPKVIESAVVELCAKYALPLGTKDKVLARALKVERDKLELYEGGAAAERFARAFSEVYAEPIPEPELSDIILHIIEIETGR